MTVGDEVQHARADDAPHDHPQVGVEDEVGILAQLLGFAHGQQHRHAEADGEEREVGGEVQPSEER